MNDSGTTTQTPVCMSATSGKPEGAADSSHLILWIKVV
ncbi:Hypothetical protein I596_969 [Dokdonella koreensis DS-123]|uniref:Uncharacterized protein n=1 Tax=Dokdonella koreensis DS-123 TaxID=1300342 RepID=A0A160DRY1_9GAMM|nr:Hypothetical protein I596_969 [Dokdonella koreensis DS-123]